MRLVLATVGVTPAIGTAPPLTKSCPAALRLTVTWLSSESPKTVRTPSESEPVVANGAMSLILPFLSMLAMILSSSADGPALFGSVTVLRRSIRLPDDNHQSTGWSLAQWTSPPDVASPRRQDLERASRKLCDFVVFSISRALAF